MTVIERLDYLTDGDSGPCRDIWDRLALVTIVALSVPLWMMMATVFYGAVYIVFIWK